MRLLDQQTATWRLYDAVCMIPQGDLTPEAQAIIIRERKRLYKLWVKTYREITS